MSQQDTPPAPAPTRVLPVVDADNVPYWTGGKDGELRIFRCQACAYYVHPPVNFCPKCESRNVVPEAVSGRGTVRSFTVNHKQWVPNLPVPYVLALVVIDEQDDVQIPCNIVNCAPDDVRMNMPVKVLFEQVEDLWVPLFEPEQI
ncbi:MAG: DNA-binding protein [Caulobacteraceae bacterium]|nr:DNA-binding protein [Caulobacteraceae bacterium]